MSKKFTPFIFLAIILLAGFLYIKKDQKLVIVDTGEVSSTEQFKMCFIYNTEAGDKANIVMNIRGGDVDGIFDWLPAEKDSKRGPFVGSISDVDPFMMARTLNVIWDASAEGVTVKEELKVIMGEGTASPGFGEMKDRGDGVYVYANPENITYAPNLSLTDCSDEALG